MTNINKVVNPGVVNIGGRLANLFCKISFDGKKLSITGVEGPLANGNCLGSCGQIVMHDWSFEEYSEGWSASMVTMFREAWEHWHLNDLTAGSPAQQDFVAKLKLDPNFRYNYTQVSAILIEAGLNPDPNHLEDGQPYKYGHKWLFREVPSAIINFLAELPTSTKTPAWA